MRCALIFLLFGIVFECHVVKRQAANDVFRDVVRQKTRGNQIQQCPCVIHPESRQCISYDSRYIAVNYEEAILSFLDLTKHHVDPAPLINSNTFSCTSQECQQCFSLLYHKLGDIGFIPGSYRSSIAPLPKSQLNPSRCPRYNFPVPIVPPVPPSNVPSYMQSLINAGKQFRNANSHSRSSLGNPPAASPPIPSSNRNNNNRNNNNANQNNQSPRNQNQNQNQNQNHNHNQNQNSRNPNPNQNQNQNRPNNNSGRQNFNQNNQNNQLQNQRTQFRNNQAMRNRFNAQQRANNAFQNTQRQFQPNQNFQNVQRPWQGQQQQFQQPQFQNTRPLQNFNGQQLQWNGRFWEPAGHAITEAIRNPIQNAVGNGWSNGWGGGQQGNAGNGGFPQAPVVVQPAPVQTLPWTGGAGDGFGGGGHVGGGWGGGGGQNQNNNGFFGGLFGGGFKQRHKRAPVPTIIGQRFTINCMARGDSEDDILALCGSCWTWRQLPDNYFPRIINELSCKPDDYCLSGWGECVQQYRNVDVLRRDNGRWVPTVITTSTCCDCRVRAGTEIHSLVIGDKH